MTNMEQFPGYAPAGFSRRFLAYILDYLILFTIAFPVGFVFGICEGIVRIALGGDIPKQVAGIFLLLQLLCSISIAILYYGKSYKRRGTSWGKQILKLKVVKLPYATHASYKEAFTREILGKIASILLLGAGYFMIIFRKDRRALHDLIADTWVLKKTD
jgi:uncharacterized RDD family membrane protein YckC